MMTSIETRTSWVVAFTALGIMSIAYGAPFVAVVALKQIAGELGSARSVPALAYSLAWLGSAFGGIAMGRIADRIGVRVDRGVRRADDRRRPAWSPPATARGGSGSATGCSSACSATAASTRRCYVYVSRWFDRRRGTALALISSGQYVAGAIWPPVFERGIARFGWRADDADLRGRCSASWWCRSHC